MREANTLWDELVRIRHELVRAAVGGLAPARRTLAALDEWIDEFARLPEGVVTAGRMGEIWGNLQLILIEGGSETRTGAGANGESVLAWQRVRRSAANGLQALLVRPEWMSLQGDFREEVLPWLIEAVGGDRAARIARCLQATEQLRLLGLRISGQPHRWRLRQVVAMTYPWFRPGGWTGRMGSTFTWPRARAVAQALMQHLRHRELGDLPLVVGYDSRVNADQVAALVTEVAATYGQPVHLCSRDTPTPAVVHYLTRTLEAGETAGGILCTAGGRPVTDSGSGVYTGTEYQGVQYLLPTGTSPSPAVTAEISRLAAEALLALPDTAPGRPTGTVTIINPLGDTVQSLLAEMGYPVPTPDGEEEVARDLVRTYWRQPGALIVIDEMHGAARGYLPAICDALGLPHETLHGEAVPLLGEVAFARPEPPHIDRLQRRMAKVRQRKGPAIGLALSMDGTELGVVDETGVILPASAVLALLTDYLLHEAYPGEPGMVIHDRIPMPQVDRVPDLPAYASRIIPPLYPDGVPPFMRDARYHQAFGDPRLLYGERVFIIAAEAHELTDLLFTPSVGMLEHRRPGTHRRERERFERGLDRLLIAGTDHGGVTTHDHVPYWDGLWAALLVLQVCAARGESVGALWQHLQGRVGAMRVGVLHLDAPFATRLAMINRYLDRPAGGESITGFTVRFAGGVRDQYLQWALTDSDGMPAFLSLSVSPDDPAMHARAQAATTASLHHLLNAVAVRLEELIVERLHLAGNPWQVVETLAALRPPPAGAGELPGTLNCRIAQEAYTRLQELAHPGREAPVLMRFVTERLQEISPEKARAVAACHLGESRGTERTPPPPRVFREGEEGQR